MESHLPAHSLNFYFSECMLYCNKMCKNVIWQRKKLFTLRWVHRWFYISCALLFICNISLLKKRKKERHPGAHLRITDKRRHQLVGSDRKQGILASEITEDGLQQNQNRHSVSSLVIRVWCCPPAWLYVHFSFWKHIWLLPLSLVQGPYPVSLTIFINNERTLQPS